MSLMFDRVLISRLSDGKILQMLDFDSSSEASSMFDYQCAEASKLGLSNHLIELRDGFGCRASRSFS